MESRHLVGEFESPALDELRVFANPELAVALRDLHKRRRSRRLELFVRRDPPASPLAALSLALTQPTAPDYGSAPAPKILEKSA